MFRPIYAYLQRAEHEAAERLRKGVKVCSKCGHERPLADFNAERRARDGHRADCRECQHEAARKAYRERVSPATPAT
jgi:ribosomal protein L37AE/L43A